MFILSLMDGLNKQKINMKTLLELRDEEKQNMASHCDGTPYKGKTFIAMDFTGGKAVIFNGSFLDPFMNTIVIDKVPGKCVHFTDNELSKFQADFV